MKKIIAVSGVAKTGKSASIRELADILDGIATRIDRVDTYNGEVKAVYEYEGYKIAIYSWGDVADNIKKGIKYAEENDCDVLIIAVRTRGGTIETLEGYAKDKSIDITYVEKVKEADFDKANEDFAKLLLDVLKRKIAELDDERIAEYKNSEEYRYIMRLMHYKRDS